MDKANLLENLSKLGLPMFLPHEEIDANVTLAELVKSHDARLWELFPVALINAAENHKFAPDAVADRLPTEEKENFHKLFLLSSAVYAYYHLTFSWLNRMKAELIPEDKSLIKVWRNSLAHDQPVIWDQTAIDSQRLKKSFVLYYQHNQDKSKRSKEKYEEFSLAYSLSQIFSPKQVELFKKKLDGLPLTKTEQEYYSRSVKKKVVALANTELHSLARKLLEQ